MFAADADARDHLEETVAHMGATLEHRGPDDSGVWADAGAGAALAFRRLSIIDLSAHGHQPMRSASGRYTIAFNGEVFNFRTLRAELEAAGAAFRGHSDTEVVLAAFEAWGVCAAIPRFIGMFAMAIWDAETRSFHLVRDRLGIKPLFVHARPGVLSFASELKAIAADPRFERAVDTDALAAYLRYLYVPAPACIYRGVTKLLPGHILTVTDPWAALPAPTPYWNLRDIAAAGLRDPFEGTDAEAVDELERLLGDAVELRLEADVPLGAFLSGGIDSSVVVALAQTRSQRPVRTFSIAFEDDAYNEAPFASAIAAAIGTDHTELAVPGRMALDVVPMLPDMYDEPFADASQIPTYLVSRMARDHVTVALSGDGGDEVFGGYNRYLHGENFFNQSRRLPRLARRAAAAGIAAIPTSSWDRAHRALRPVLPAAMQTRLPGLKLQKVGTLLRCEDAAAMYQSLTSAWTNPAIVTGSPLAAADPVHAVFAEFADAPMLARMLLHDQLVSLADDQLAKVDRASMAVGLEVRVPILDHRIVEFSWRLPAELKVRAGAGKWPLRQVLYRHVSPHLLDREKMGFSVPLAAWLRGPLRGWAEELLEPRRLEAGGMLRAEPIVDMWRALRAGRDDSAMPLWPVLMFQAWRERWLP